MAVLYKFLYKPVLKMLDDRQNKIETGLKQAKEIEKNLFESQGEKEKIVRAARDEAGRVISESKEMAGKIREELANKARMEAAAILENGKKQLEDEKEAILKEVKKDAADMIHAGLQKILNNTMDAKLDKKIVDKTLEQL